MLYIHMDIVLRSNKLDPIAWAIKYLMAASVSWNLEEVSIRGKNDIKLISRANHSINQFLLERAIILLKTIVIDIDIVNGVINIKAR